MEGSTQELRHVLSSPPPNWIPPPGGPPNQITILHASLEHLRDSGDPQYLFLRTTLEVLSLRGFLGGCGNNDNANAAATTTTPLSGEEEQLLFHCITGLRHVVLTRWDAFAPSLRGCLRDLLLAVGLGVASSPAHAADDGAVVSQIGNGGSTSHHDHHHLPRTVALACLGCASSFWKRGWSEDGSSSAAVAKDDQQSYLEALICGNFLPGAHRFRNEGELFDRLNASLAAPFDQQSQQLPSVRRRRHAAAMSASFLSLLAGEFSVGGNSSARYNLPVEFHRARHRSFEGGDDIGGSAGVTPGESGLDATMRVSMTALSSMVGYILNDANGNESSGAMRDESFLELGASIVDATCDVLSWEFGAGASTNRWALTRSGGAMGGGGGSGNQGGAALLLRPPQRWREALINPEFLGAMFGVYAAVRVGLDVAGGHGPPPANLGGGGGPTFDGPAKRGKLAHLLRQLLLQLSSIAGGPIFADEDERGAYAGFLLDGCLNALESVLNESQQKLPPAVTTGGIASAEIVDLVTILSRLTTNFGVRVLCRLPSFPRFLNALCAMGGWLLETSLAECERARGDIESAEGMEWRNDAIAQILQCSDAMADDYWLACGNGGQEALNASHALGSVLAQLYGPYCICRVRMSCLEEHFATQEEADLDEIREEISAVSLEEEMASAASLGRLNVMASMTTLSGMFQQTTPRLMSLFEGVGAGGGEITPEIAALLEEARMLILCAGHLLTDDCIGETPAIPESVTNACRPGRGGDGESCMASIAGLIESLKSVSEAQASRVTAYPADPRLSPLLAKTLLWFFRRWGPAYILPALDGYVENAGGGILSAYSTPETAQPVVTFCTTLCLLFFCHWPQEKEVNDESTSLLLALAKKGPFMRQLLLNSPSFEQLVALHSICASLRHNASQPEVTAAMTAIGGNLPIDVVRGYIRLPYADRARVLTCLAVACSEMQDEKATAMLNSCLSAAKAPFAAIVQALSNKQANSNDVNVQESACLSILLYGGIALASEMSEPERIPHFITPSLPHLSGLMTFYAEDLTICESLLKLFRDYSERYIAMMTRDQCLALFTASASLLRHYSENHCKNRVIRKRSSEAIEEEFEEEQNYSDVMCAIQLLIHLGTKDFTDLCNASMGPTKRVETSQITDVIFFGLQQLLPLMTQGLLQFPTLCQHYFSLVGFMVETYPEKLCALPFDLFNSLLDSLLFGMSHSDSLVSKSSLQGLASLAREHLKTRALAAHLSAKGDIFGNCTSRLIREVVFQPIIWDRLEPAGLALLPLAAIDVQKFIALVNAISQQLGSDDKQRRLHAAFEMLIKPSLLAKVAAEGREGRVVRVQFKKDFDVFVRDVQSFLIIK